MTSENENQLKVESAEGDTRPRAALYVDGFNLYYPICELGENHLKWACLWRLGETICERGGQRLVRVVFCTAVPKVERDVGKHDRHIRFNAAQRARGVTVINGHYVSEPVMDAGVASGKEKWTEKQTDINVSLSLLFDGTDNLYDVAFLLSADTDQVATARVFSERLAPLGKTLIGVAPPGRKHPQGYGQYGINGFSITKYQLERCVMSEVIQGPDKPILRPDEYAPPADWVHPDARPKGKPSKTKIKWGKGFRL